MKDNLTSLKLAGRGRGIGEAIDIIVLGTTSRRMARYSPLEVPTLHAEGRGKFKYRL